MRTSRFNRLNYQSFCIRVDSTDIYIRQIVYVFTCTNGVCFDGFLSRLFFAPNVYVLMERVERALSGTVSQRFS